MDKYSKKMIKSIGVENGLKGSVSVRLLDIIAHNLTIIRSAKKQLTEDSKRTKEDGGSIPYGFDIDKSGRLCPHAGTVMIREAEAAIRATLKQLGVDPKVEVKKVSSLRDMIVTKKKQA